jgi:hypothetical protein
MIVPLAAITLIVSRQPSMYSATARIDPSSVIPASCAEARAIVSQVQGLATGRTAAAGQPAALIALFGYMARAPPAVNAGVKAGGGNAQLSVPLLFEHMFPSWFAGSATRPLSSARSSPRPSCRSPRRTCLPAASTTSSSIPMPPRPGRPGSRLAWLIIKVGAPRPEPPRGWVSR